MRIRRLIHIARVRGVDVYLHWSACVVAAVLLFSAIIQNAIFAAVAILAFAGVMLLHELGHAEMARRRAVRVLWIELYPIHGMTRFEQPSTKFDDCLIAWGGVLAQAIVAIPLVTWIMLFGYTASKPINAILAILGGYSLAVAAFNLLPIRGLDGSKAWRLMPILLRRWYLAARIRKHASRPRKLHLTVVKRKNGPTIH
jgi:Zn-dependent protease